MQRELLGPSAIIFETLHGPWILGAGRGFGSHSSIFPPQQKSSLEYPWLSFSLCLNIPVTEFTVFPGNPFHIWLFILMAGAQRMLVGRNDIEQHILHGYLLSSAEQQRTHLPCLLLQELLNIQNSAFLPPWLLLITRHSVVFFQAHLRRIEHPGLTDRTCVVIVLLYFLAFYDLVLSSYGFLESRLCTDLYITHLVTIFLLMKPRPVFALFSCQNTLVLDLGSAKTMGSQHWILHKFA